jgi:hypothetical protein
MYKRLFEDAEEAGKLELTKITLEQAISFCSKNNFNVEKEIPNFAKNFKNAQSKAKMGWTQRRDMPVIETEDVKELQARLESGKLDINKPFSHETLKSNPFPTGLKGFAAKKWLELGLTDGSIKDDQIDVEIDKAPVGKLIPIQRQIYFDKAMGSTIKFGMDASLSFITKKSFFIISSNYYIIDGHHRFLSAMLINPSISANALKINLPIKKLLPLSVAYGDAIGHKRNL